MTMISGPNLRSRGRIEFSKAWRKAEPPSPGLQRRVDDGVVLAALVDGAGAGIKRHLVGRAIHHGLVRPENILRAVAVMDVEVDDRGARDAVMVLRIARRDGGIVEQAEAHRPRDLGVMAGRARRDEGIRRLLRHHFVDGVHRAARRAQRRLEAAGRHRGVGVEPHHAFLGRRLADLQDVFHRMAERDGLERRRRRLDAHQRVEFFGRKRARNGAQPVGPLRMAERREMVETGRMGDEQSGHRNRSHFGRPLHT